MSSWRYLAETISGDGEPGEVVDLDLPLEDVAIEDSLSGQPGMTGSITPQHLRLLGNDGTPLLKPWGTAIWAEIDGQIRGGGIYTEPEFDSDGSWKLDCVGYAGYLDQMPYTGAWYGVEIDPLDVVREIWRHVQAEPGGNLGLEISDLETGLKIGEKKRQVEFDTESGPVSFEAGPVKLAWYQTHNLAEEVDRLAEETPFDYRERHFWDGDQIKHRLEFGYPSIGRFRNDLRFVIGENVATPGYSGGEYASEVLMLGAGEGRTIKRSAATRPRRGRLRRVAVVSDSAIRRQKPLDARAEAEVALRSGAGYPTEIVIRNHKNAELGSFAPGDEIYIEGRVDWGELGFRARILSTVTSPSSDQVASLTVAATDTLAS